MAGLLSKPEEETPVAAGESVPADGAGSAQPETGLPMEEPTQQDMAVYNKVVDNIRQLIYAKDGFDAVMQTVQSAPTPVIGIVDIVANAAAAAYISAKQAKVPVTNDMMVQAIAETTEEAVDAIEKIGRTEISSDEATNAYVEAVASFGQILEERGMLDQQGATQQLQNMMARQQQGGDQPMLSRRERRAMEAQKRKGAK